RDLKPANIMVGAFGEVFVVDWGLAKVLGQRSTAGPEAGQLKTTRSEHVVGESAAGSVFGTVSYMPPEQAAGRVDELETTADVFAIGALLCEILTGKPPYVRDEGEDLLARARHGDLGPAFLRLDHSGVDAELVGLAKHCLAANPGGRPQDAGAVADTLRGFLA